MKPKLHKHEAPRIDKDGQLTLHGFWRKKLGLKPGDRITLTVIGDEIVIMRRTAFGGLEISDRGVIKIPAEIREQFGWVEGSRIFLCHMSSLGMMKVR